MFASSLPLLPTSVFLRTGEIDLFEWINKLCDRVGEVEPSILSLIPEANRRQRLLIEAGELLGKYPDPNNRPPLFGIPIGVKDIFRVDGFATQCGSQLPPSLFEGNEASCVTKMKAAGALILGKTVTTEFAYFESGPTRNPYNIKHTPGGSSSGSAAAVASGLTPFAFGTQTIGSIIRPAAFCGVIGFKPSYGRISTDGVIPFSPSADHIGFFTQDIQGCILAASLLCDDWDDAACTKSSTRPFTFGVPEGAYLELTSAEVLSAFERQLDVLLKHGCTIKYVPVFNDIAEINRKHREMVAAEMAEVHTDWFAQYESLYRHHTRQIILEGQQVSALVLNEAKKGRFALRNSIKELKDSYEIDIWISPATLTTAPEGLTSTGSPLMNLPWTYAGVPAITIPAGKNDSCLPFGLQFCGGFNEDEKLLSCLIKINEFFNPL